MGFMDELRLRNVFNPGALSQFDPLFGGLLPRRIIEDEQPRVAPQQQRVGALTRDNVGSVQQPSSRVNGMRDVSQRMNEGKQEPGMVRFYDSSLEDRKLRLEQEKFDFARSDIGRKSDLEERKFGLDEEKFGHERSQDAKTHDINLRKQALDEWKNKNPEGQIETDKDGRIMVINKQTGKSIDTGLKSGDLTEEQKIKLNLQNSMTLEGERQKNRIALEKVQQGGRVRNVSPAQQRIAEQDAARDLLNGDYRDLGEYVGFDDSGKLVINKPTARTGLFDNSEAIKQINNRIAAFEKDLKTRSDERINRTYSLPNSITMEDSADTDIIDMIAPDGGALKVPKGEVDALKKAGARLANEAAAPAKPTIPVADGIELLYNDAGKVIGARNRRAPK